MNHLKEENIIALIDSATIEPSVKEHLSECDLCFRKYATIKSNYLELKDAQLEKTPKSYLEHIEKEFDLSTIETKETDLTEVEATDRGTYKFELPVTKKKIVFKFLNAKDDSDINSTRNFYKKL